MDIPSAQNTNPIGSLIEGFAKGDEARQAQARLQLEKAKAVFEQLKDRHAKLEQTLANKDIPDDFKQSIFPAYLQLTTALNPSVQFSPNMRWHSDMGDALASGAKIDEDVASGKLDPQMGKAAKMHILQETLPKIADPAQYTTFQENLMGSMQTLKNGLSESPATVTASGVATPVTVGNKPISAPNVPAQEMVAQYGPGGTIEKGLNQKEATEARINAMEQARRMDSQLADTRSLLNDIDKNEPGIMSKVGSFLGFDTEASKNQDMRKALLQKHDDLRVQRTFHELQSNLTPTDPALVPPIKILMSKGLPVTTKNVEFVMQQMIKAKSKPPKK